MTKQWMASKIEENRALQAVIAYSHKIRIEMIEVLIIKKKMKAGDFNNVTKMSQPVTSTHLKILRKSGLFKSDKIGKTIFYTPDDNKIEIIKNLITQFQEN